MASFEIDTGSDAPRRMFSMGMPEVLMDGVLDSLPTDATQAQIDDRLVQHVMGMLRQPRTLATVRRKLVALLPLLAGIAEREPAQFDAILLEYLDRQQTLAE
jgi:hypothetical protein